MLIMVHKNPKCLRKLSYVLDDERFEVEKFHFWKLQKYPRILWRVNWALDLLKIRKQTKEEYETSKGIKIYFAPIRHVLSYECVKYVLQNYKKYYCYFKFAFALDELLIPTAIFNSPYCKHCLQSEFPFKTHYNEIPTIHYIDYGACVRVFNENDYEDLIHTDKLFFRKIESGTSDALIGLLEKYRMSAK